MSKSIEVTVTIGETQVHLKGPEDFVRGEVRHLTSSLVGTPTLAKAVGAQAAVPALGPNEAQIIAEKRPANQTETVAVLAYALKSSGADEFSEVDIERAYKRARVRYPKAIGQAIRDAKNHFDYIEPGSKRGLYRLSRHGERTVEFDMPRDTQTGASR